MKGLSIKRIAAIGIGAALVGSALAPVVSAANMVPTGLDGFQKDYVITATGAPAVDVVVGANAAISDVVWAGNIAARVAQLATKPVTCTAGAGTVDLTVGGTTTMSGEGELVEKVANLAAVGNEFGSITVKSSKMPSLVNNNSASWKINGSKTTVKIKETLETTGNVGVYAQANNSSSAYAFGEILTAVPAGSIKYVLDLSDTPIEAGQSGMDANSKVDIEIPWLGETYIVDSVNSAGTRIVLYSNTLPTELETGAKLDVTPTTKYAGKEVEVQLVDLFESQVSTGYYEAKWAVSVDGVVQDYYSGDPSTNSYDLKDVFDDDYFTDTITVSNAGRNSAAGTYTATIRTGSDRLELVNGKGYPFADDKDVDDIAQWEVAIGLTGGDVSSITLENQWAYTKDSGKEGDTSKYALKVGEEIVLPNDFAKFSFIGFQDKPMVDAVLGAEALEFTDPQGNKVVVPYYARFSLDDNNVGTVTLGEMEFTFGASDNDTFYWEEGDIDTDDPTSLDSGAKDYNSLWNALDSGSDTADLDLGYENASNVATNVSYYFTRVGDEAALVLVGSQPFDLETSDSTGATIEIVDTNADGATGVGYYFPNFNDFEEVVSGFTHDDDIYMAAYFEYTATDSSTVDLYMRSDEEAMVWGAEDLEDMSNITMYGPGYDAIAGQFKLSENEDDLDALLLNDGSTIVVDGGTFVISVPDEERLVEAYLGSVDSTESVVGGASYTGVVAGETKGNVTVTAVNCGAGSASAVEVVGVDDLVKTSKTSGKSIIVGGWVANAAAANLEVDAGKTLEDLLLTDGDYVAAVLTSGDIVVAGKTAADTGSAARALITALENELA